MRRIINACVDACKGKLYNVLFPMWMLILFPATWLMILPGNFLIDSLVLLVSMVAFKMEEKGQCYKKHILPIYAFGMLSDIVGAAFLWLMAVVLELGGPYCDSPLVTVPAVLIAAVLIFVLNHVVTFRKLEGSLRWRLALIFAIVTAPYTFLVPSSWMY